MEVRSRILWPVLLAFWPALFKPLLMFVDRKERESQGEVL
jgi:hypothetical protein